MEICDCTYWEYATFFFAGLSAALIIGGWISTR